MSPRLEGLAWACVVVLLSASFYEALVALEVVPPGSEPGDEAAGSDFVLVAAMLAYLAAAAASFGHAFEKKCAPRPVLGRTRTGRRRLPDRALVHLRPVLPAVAAPPHGG